MTTEILANTKNILQTELNFKANEAIELFVKIINDTPNLADIKTALIFNPKP